MNVGVEEQFSESYDPLLQGFSSAGFSERREFHELLLQQCAVL
jgi:hypothetical protein